MGVPQNFLRDLQPKMQHCLANLVLKLRRLVNCWLRMKQLFVQLLKEFQLKSLHWEIQDFMFLLKAMPLQKL
jgi:hypothetical protein